MNASSPPGPHQLQDEVHTRLGSRPASGCSRDVLIERLSRFNNHFRGKFNGQQAGASCQPSVIA